MVGGLENRFKKFISRFYIVKSEPLPYIRFPKLLSLKQRQIVLKKIMENF